MSTKEEVIVERLSNVGPWELYRFADAASDDVVCKVALRAGEGEEEVEYGVWRGEDAEPSATGNIDWEGAWHDGAREHVLQKIAGAYEEALPEVRRGLTFHIGEEDDGDEDDGEEEDEDDQED